MTAVEWLEEELKANLKKVILEGDSELMESLFEQAKEIEEMKIIEAKIELIKSIGNQGKNTPLYGILKSTLIELQLQHNEILARCFN